MNELQRWKIGLAVGLAVLLAGCVPSHSGSIGQVEIYPSSNREPNWLRNGGPIEFEGYKWYPVNDYEVLDDEEVLQVAKYKGMQVFVAKISTRPYDRIYTKFGKNKFRYFQRREDD